MDSPLTPSTVRLALVAGLAVLGVGLAVWSGTQFQRGEPTRRALPPGVPAEGWEPIEQLQTAPDPADAARMEDAIERRGATYDFVSTKDAAAVPQVAASVIQQLGGVIEADASPAASHDLLEPVLNSIFDESEDDFLSTVLGTPGVGENARGAYGNLYAAIQHVLGSGAIAVEGVRVSRFIEERRGPGGAGGEDPGLSISMNTQRSGGPRPDGPRSESDADQGQSLSTMTFNLMNVLDEDELGGTYAVEIPFRKSAGSDKNAAQHARILMTWLPKSRQWQLSGFQFDAESQEAMTPVIAAIRARAAERQEQGGGS